TQSALLEAMEERQVSVDGVTYPLAPPFMVLATQNPVETETTFALPAAQLDRFLFKLSMGYPTPREEAAMLRTVGDGAAFADLRPLLSPEEVNRFTREIRQVRLSDPVVAYIVELVQATREQPELACGASPRVSRDLFRASKAYAALSGRDYVTPDDVKYLARYVLPHRVLLSHQAALSGLEAAGVVETVLAQVPCRETGEVLAHGQNA
ncbi:MoxR family ATPase, partial [Dysosmobacter sp.]